MKDYFETEEIKTLLLVREIVPTAKLKALYNPSNQNDVRWEIVDVPFGPPCRTTEETWEKALIYLKNKGKAD
jgi:hypothetical protein